MLTFHRRTVTKERMLAERGLTLFLTVPGLRWEDAYAVAVYERVAHPDRFQQLLARIGKGESFTDARRALAPSDTKLPPASQI